MSPCKYNYLETRNKIVKLRHLESLRRRSIRDCDNAEEGVKNWKLSSSWPKWDDGTKTNTDPLPSFAAWLRYTEKRLPARDWRPTDTQPSLHSDKVSPTHDPSTGPQPLEKAGRHQNEAVLDDWFRVNKSFLDKWIAGWGKTNRNNVEMFTSQREELKRLLKNEGIDTGKWEDLIKKVFRRKILEMSQQRVSHDRTSFGGIVSHYWKMSTSDPASTNENGNQPTGVKPDIKNPSSPTRSPDGESKSSRNDSHPISLTSKPTLDSSQGYTIDPITMRKVPCKANDAEPSGALTQISPMSSEAITPKQTAAFNPIQAAEDGSIDIPIKNSSEYTSLQQDSTTKSAGDQWAWLTPGGSPPSASEPPSTSSIHASDSTKSHRQESLDQAAPPPLFKTSLVRGKTIPSGIPYASYGTVDQTEDLDLLRSSDVRASSGILKGVRRQSNGETLQRRKQLIEDFKAEPDAEHSEDLASAQEKVKSVRKTHDPVKTKVEEVSNPGRISFVSPPSEQHIMEATTQDATKLEPYTGECDISDNVSAYVETSCIASVPDPKGLKKHSQNYHDLNLVREIRGIYEENYGTIDTKHRQPSQPLSALKEDPEATKIDVLTKGDAQTFTSTPTETNLNDKEKSQNPRDHSKSSRTPCWGEVPNSNGTIPDSLAPKSIEYKILAFDTSTQQVSMASTISSLPSQIASAASETIMSAPEVLLSLASPARFLPYISPLQAEGYEIIRGSGDIIVFKKVRDPLELDSKVENTDSTPSHTTINPGDGTRTALPTESADSKDVPPLTSADTVGAKATRAHSSSGDKVSRQENVFSGERRWEDEKASNEGSRKGGARRTVKRVFWGAAWVAACSYAIGVVAEFFKTGGADGLGPQGF